MNENRYSFIAAFPKRGRDWNFTEIGNVETLRGPLRSAAGKNLMVFSTAVADEVAHILDNADDRNHHFVEHRLGSNDIRERNVLRGRDQKRPADLELLGECNLYVARAWRHIDYQVIQLAPVNIRHQLMQRFP